VQVDPVEQRAGQAVPILLDHVGGAAAATAGVAGPAAGAGIHRRDQLEARGEVGIAAQARHRDHAGLKRLAQRIGIIGFSAGGHLASTAATHFDAGHAAATDPTERASSRPDFAVLVYPVISMGEKGHGGSKQNLLGPNPPTGLADLFSNEKQVTAQTSPTYLAHAVDDRVVSIENSRLFHDALKAKGVSTQCLELPFGDHGLNGYQGPMWDAWQSGALNWLASLKLIPERAVDSPQ